MSRKGRAVILASILAAVLLGLYRNLVTPVFRFWPLILVDTLTRFPGDRIIELLHLRVTAVTYELMSGRQPFDVSDPGSLISRTPDSRPPRLDGPKDTSRALDRVLASALATRPADRPASAAAFADALEHVAAGSKTTGVKRVRREVSPSLLLTLAVLVFGASAAATAYLAR